MSPEASFIDRLVEEELMDAVSMSSATGAHEAEVQAELEASEVEYMVSLAESQEHARLVESLVEEELEDALLVASEKRELEEAQALADEEEQRIDYLAALVEEAEHVSTLRTVGDPCFRACPDEEVDWWVRHLLQAPIDEAVDLWRRIPQYSQYILQHEVSEVAEHCLAGIKSMRENAIDGDAALLVAPRLGAVLPLPMAVCVQFCSLTTAKPAYFLVDMLLGLTANLLHPKQKVNCYRTDPDFLVSPRYSCLLNGDTTAGKSPSYNLCKDLFVQCTQTVPQLWPFASMADNNMHSDGSHGMFNACGSAMAILHLWDQKALTIFHHSSLTKVFATKQAFAMFQNFWSQPLEERTNGVQRLK